MWYSSDPAGCAEGRARSTRSFSISSRNLLPLVALCVACPLPDTDRLVKADPATAPSQSLTVNLDSGLVSATGAGTEPVIVFSQIVAIDGVPWMRLHFATVQLSGIPSTNNGSFLRLTSLADGAMQILDVDGLAKWGNSTGAFNGDRVLLELLAYPGTGDNRVVVDKVRVGSASQGTAGATAGGACDQIVPSTDPRVGRLVFDKLDQPSNTLFTTWCTAFMFNDRPNDFLTASHCCTAICWPGDPCDPGGEALQPFVEFNVPPSTARGDIQHAKTIDQYPVDRNSVQEDRPTPTSRIDWCYFGVQRNVDTGLTPLEKQGDSFRLADIVPAADPNIIMRVTGHNRDAEPLGCGLTGTFNEFHGTQSTDTGPFAEHVVDERVSVDAQSRPGSSGAAYEDVCRGLVYGILSGGNECFDSAGTPIDVQALQNALACPRGVAADCNGNGIADWCDVDCGARCFGGGCGAGCVSTSVDCNNNGVPDECEPDCNLNGTADSCDIANGTLFDLNDNLIPDECETLVDCNGNGIQDVCDIARGTSQDFNRDGIPDECQVGDCDNNGVQDVREDCNGNLLADACDIAQGTSRDCGGAETDCCNPHDCPGCDDPVIETCVCASLPSCCAFDGRWDATCVAAVWLEGCGNCAAPVPDGIPDECQDLDCDDNGIPDACDLSCTAGALCEGFQTSCGTGADCNGNCVLDRCDLASFPPK